jgi:hypothetical protein
MSKVQLQGNVSGTGVFTIASPNSNTDRTLTLPDNTGTILTSATTDPALVFKRSNILGTVSQSAGVPTGAIIERGSNSNGQYVRYADGTQICWAVDIVFTVGGVSNVTWSFPAAFVNGDNLAYAYLRTGGSDSGSITFGIQTIYGNTTTSTEFYLMKLNGSRFATSGTASCCPYAIGRWY